jgi:hypothetical protein
MEYVLAKTVPTREKRTGNYRFLSLKTVAVPYNATVAIPSIVAARQ